MEELKLKHSNLVVTDVRFREAEGAGSTIANAVVEFNNGLDVLGYRVNTGENGLWVAAPNREMVREGEVVKNDDGTTRYVSTVGIDSSKDFRAVLDKVKAEFLAQTEIAIPEAPAEG